MSRYRIGDRIAFFWRGKTRELVLTDVREDAQFVVGKDPATGKNWHCEYEHITGVVERAA